jgi:hypothetical protein
LLDGKRCFRGTYYFHLQGTTLVGYLIYFVAVYQSRRLQILELHNINIHPSEKTKSHIRNVISLYCVMYVPQDDHIHHCPTLIDWLCSFMSRFCSFGYGDDDGMLLLGRTVEWEGGSCLGLKFQPRSTLKKPRHVFLFNIK